MRKLLICLLLVFPLGVLSDGCLPALEISAKTKEYKTVSFATNLHCENCVKKVVENISYLKGVKDLNVSLDKQEILIKFDPSKTNVETLKAEIKKLGYPAIEKNTNTK